ncbi:hypothetical protein MRX96_021957 [Rhipicephalus microplus]
MVKGKGTLTWPRRQSAFFHDITEPEHGGAPDEAAGVFLFRSASPGCQAEIAPRRDHPSVAPSTAFRKLRDNAGRERESLEGDAKSEKGTPESVIDVYRKD